MLVQFVQEANGEPQRRYFDLPAGTAVVKCTFVRARFGAKTKLKITLHAKGNGGDWVQFPGATWEGNEPLTDERFGKDNWLKVDVQHVAQICIESVVEGERLETDLYFETSQ